MNTIDLLMTTPHDPILAFLQNAYIRPEHRRGNHVKKYAENPDYRRRCLAVSMTGRRLLKAWGEDYSKVYWDNSNPIAGETRRDMLGADPAHMRRVIEEVKPAVIVCYGKQALQGMGSFGCGLKLIHRHSVHARVMFYKSCWARVVIACPHPAAFDISTAALMKCVADEALQFSTPVIVS